MLQKSTAPQQFIETLKFIYFSHAFYLSPQSLKKNFAMSSVRSLFCPSLAQ